MLVENFEVSAFTNLESRVVGRGLVKVYRVAVEWMRFLAIGIDEARMEDGGARLCRFFVF